MSHNCGSEQNTTDTDYEALSYIVASDYRTGVVLALADTGPLTPSEITGRVDFSGSHVSRALGELREQGAVDLLVPDAVRKGRLHGLSDAGKSAVPELRKREKA